MDAVAAGFAAFFALSFFIALKRDDALLTVAFMVLCAINVYLATRRSP